VNPKQLVVCLVAFSLLGLGVSGKPSFAAHLAALPDFQISVSDIVASGLNAPVGLTHAGDGSGRLFVLEQTGRIRIVQNNNLLVTPFLDVSDLISCCGERGLLGIAFHPNYSSNGYFYINYTNKTGTTVVARYQASPPSSNIANPASAQILFTISQPYANHNGGHLAFGMDGYLYISVGDGGSGGDPHNYAQNLTSPLGKLLRIDVNSGAPYAIPPDNPYFAHPTADKRIWASGLRNPWRFSFDRVTGDLYIGDVGQGTYEEIDFQPANTLGGVNFGWRCYEGPLEYNFTAPPCNDPGFRAGLTAPITGYTHAEGYSVTGGYVYRGSRYPRLTGVYFFADYVASQIWSIKMLSRNPFSWSARVLELNTGLNISSFGEDQAGELYILDHSGGTIRRLADTAPSLALSNIQSSSTHANPGEILTFTITLVNSSNSIASGLHLENILPAGCNYLTGTLSATAGVVNASQAPHLMWDGAVNPNSTVTISYQAAIQPGFQGSLVNSASITGSGIEPLERTVVVSVPRPPLATTPTDFFLPGTQPGSLTNSLVDSTDCDICHSPPIYDTWRGSMMSNSGRDPLTWAAIAASNALVPNAGEFCLRCHTPMGWLAGRSSQPDGSSLTNQDIRNGISCSVCHRMIDPVASTNDEAVTIDAGIRSALPNPKPPTNHSASGMSILDPQDRRRGPFSLPANPARHSAWRTDFLSQGKNALTESRLCGTCHNIDNPLLSWNGAEFLPNSLNAAAPSFNNGALFPIERTFDEWKLSQYATSGVFAPQFAGQKPDGIVRTCQDCHMQRATGYAADLIDPVFRDCLTTGCLPLHDLVGPNTWIPSLLSLSNWRLNASSESTYLQAAMIRSRDFLMKSATLEVNVTDNGGSKTAIVKVTNQTGHKLPTGYPEGRRMWLNIQAFDAAGNKVFESGAYNFNTAELASDTYLRVYEIKQGITQSLVNILKAQNPLLVLSAGESFHFALNNTTIKDTRIPPRGYTVAAFNQPGLAPFDPALPGNPYSDGQYWDEVNYPLPSSAARVLVILYYQTASKEYIDFLKQYGGEDGFALQNLWGELKSPPQVAGVAFFPVQYNHLPNIQR